MGETLAFVYRPRIRQIAQHGVHIVFKSEDDRVSTVLYCYGNLCAGACIHPIHRQTPLVFYHSA